MAAERLSRCRSW